MPSAKVSQSTFGGTRQHLPEPTGRCAVELRLPIALQDRLLAIAEAGVLGQTVDDVASHFIRESLHRDWLALEELRERVSTIAAPAPAPPALVRSVDLLSARAPCGEKRLVRMPEVCKRIGVSRSSLYKMINLKSFPPPKRLGGRSVAWLESDIETWIDSRTHEINT
jgi:prophage regulatory protein